MFFLAAVAATFFYALQSNLMVHYYRKIDAPSAISYRGLALALSMAPVLIFVKAEQFLIFFQHFPTIVVSAFLTTFSNWSMAYAYRLLPVGIAITLGMALWSVFSAAFSYLVFGEILSVSELSCIFCILACVIWLGRTKSGGKLPQDYHPRKGIIFCVIYSLFLSVGYLGMAKVAREAGPLVSGYAWETLIGFMSAGLCLAKGRVGFASLAKISKRDFLTIIAYSSPTAIATVLSAYAASHGKIALVTAIMATGIVMSTLLAFFIHKEVPGKRQYLPIAAILFSLIALRLLSG